MNAEFQRIARRDKKAFLSDQCKEIEENNRMGKTRDSAIGIPMSPPSQTSLPPPSPSHLSRLSQSPSLSSLSHRANSHWLSVSHVVVCMPPCSSVHSSHPLGPPPSPGPQVCSVCLCLHCCPANTTINHSKIHFCIFILQLLLGL